MDAKLVTVETLLSKLARYNRYANIRCEGSPVLKYWVGFEGLYKRFIAWLMRMPTSGSGCCCSPSWPEACAVWLRWPSTSVARTWRRSSLTAPRPLQAIPGFGGPSSLPHWAGCCRCRTHLFWSRRGRAAAFPRSRWPSRPRSGFVSVKETVGKFVLCDIQLGVGASLGVEGPTVHICAGVSSLAGQDRETQPQEFPPNYLCGHGGGNRRRLQRPIAAVTFTLEELRIQTWTRLVRDIVSVAPGAIFPPLPLWERCFRATIPAGTHLFNSTATV